MDHDRRQMKRDLLLLDSFFIKKCGKIIKHALLKKQGLFNELVTPVANTWCPAGHAKRCD
jgi:hypothetical protein